MEEATEECVIPSPSVLPIDRKTVHQICSGQVVLNLATAVKELLENSLDAGATIVEIRLKENGAELVEVSDNGYGVEPQNFAALTLKHHTSKIREFSDLSSVETFGFRGEALSSLCALSNLTVTTKHKSQIAATKLVYDHDGKLQSQTACARQQGTTVSLSNIFSSLPVRHKEFLRNIKKELVKLVHVLHGYCIITNGVRITCTNQLEKGKKNTIVSTLGSEQIKENIGCLFGPKQVKVLIPFKQVQPTEEECNEYLINTPNQSNLFQVTGFVSKADHGLGRSTADRQFYFVNKRPCDLLKVSRVVNEVYHMYNRHQYPFVVLDISLQRDIVDVNVTPDKRKVFMQEEKVLLATIKSSLKSMYDPGTSTYGVNQKPLEQLSFSLKENTEQVNGKVILNKDPNELVENVSIEEETPRKDFLSIAGFKRKFSVMEGKSAYKKAEPKAKQPKLTAFCNSVLDFGSKLSSKSSSGSNKEAVEINEKVEEAALPDNKVETVTEDKNGFLTEETVKSDMNECTQIEMQESKEMEEKAQTVLNPVVSLDRCNEKESKLSQEKELIISKESSEEEEVTISKESSEEKEVTISKESSEEKEVTIIEDKRKCISKVKTSKTQNKAQIRDFHASLEHRKAVQVEFNMKLLKEAMNTKETGTIHETKSLLFRAKIAPESNTAAEEELTKNISKESFSKMKILGQFNLGFILTRLDNDIFIIDQHASDEKYNFESLQKNSSLQTQKLIIPQQLELTPVNESILIDNIEIFCKNGFEFHINDEAQATKKVQLVSVPVSKNWTFGVEDVEELIFMLSDSPGVVCRPTRVRKMFASRACRMSTMIGKALSHDEMKTIVTHMGQIEHPWNCPHGRPTMRHVISLDMIETNHNQ